MTDLSPHARQQLRDLPAMNTVLDHPQGQAWIAHFGRQAITDILREYLQTLRERIIAGETIATDLTTVLQTCDERIHATFLPSLRPVINATGVIIHTNLGRAILSQEAQRAVQSVAESYSNLEFDIGTGKRGSRYTHAEDLITTLTGAESALVVNNNASALVLILSALAHQREVVLSRSQLVEIGGGFRIPDMMVQSGAHLIEVGTTNRTRIADYENALTPQTALLMRIHTSNFKLVGFVENPTLHQLATLAHQHDRYLVDDIGSGALLDLTPFGLDAEPTVQASVQAGADLILFSGDKLLGGPQAGIIIGKTHLIETLKRHPLARVLRADKLCYAALNATIDHYRKGEAIHKIPVWRMIAMSPQSLHDRATHWMQHLGQGTVIASESTIGGGSLPGATLPTFVLALNPASPDALMLALRSAPTPIIARILDDRVFFDPRTILPETDEHFLAMLAQVLHSSS